MTCSDYKHNNYTIWSRSKREKISYIQLHIGSHNNRQFATLVLNENYSTICFCSDVAKEKLNRPVLLIKSAFLLIYTTHLVSLFSRAIYAAGKLFFSHWN